MQAGGVAEHLTAHARYRLVQDVSAGATIIDDTDVDVVLVGASSDADEDVPRHLAAINEQLEQFLHVPGREGPEPRPHFEHEAALDGYPVGGGDHVQAQRIDGIQVHAEKLQAVVAPDEGQLLLEGVGGLRDDVEFRGRIRSGLPEVNAVVEPLGLQLVDKGLVMQARGLQVAAMVVRQRPHLFLEHYERPAHPPSPCVPRL